MHSLKIIEKKNNNDLYLMFFSKKIEKIVVALYLLTSYFPKDEALKWKLREQSIQLLSDIMSLKKRRVFYKDKVLSDIKNAIRETISFLEIASTAKIISNMNLDVFKKEFEFLLKLINNNLTDIGEQDLPVLRGDFFKIKDKDLRPEKIETLQNSIKDNISTKGHSKGHPLFSSLLPNKVGKQSISNVEKKQTRKDAILKFLRKGQTLTIKDICQVVGDCSEKTIQRELQSMMKEGVLKKEGERRWSRYSRSDL